MCLVPFRGVCLIVTLVSKIVSGGFGGRRVAKNHQNQVFSKYSENSENFRNFGVHTIFVAPVASELWQLKVGEKSWPGCWFGDAPRIGTPGRKSWFRKKFSITSENQKSVFAKKFLIAIENFWLKQIFDFLSIFEDQKKIFPYIYKKIIKGNFLL